MNSHGQDTHAAILLIIHCGAAARAGDAGGRVMIGYLYMWLGSL
jgi:hypothetical protein